MLVGCSSQSNPNSSMEKSIDQIKAAFSLSANSQNPTPNEYLVWNQESNQVRVSTIETKTNLNDQWIVMGKTTNTTNEVWYRITNDGPVRFYRVGNWFL